MSIGSKIKSLRRAKDLTQEELAEVLGISAKAVSQWECGRTALRDAAKKRDMSVCSLYVKCQHMNVKFMPQRLVMKIWTGAIRKYIKE